MTLRTLLGTHCSLSVNGCVNEYILHILKVYSQVAYLSWLLEIEYLSYMYCLLFLYMKVVAFAYWFYNQPLYGVPKVSNSF